MRWRREPTRRYSEVVAMLSSQRAAHEAEIAHLIAARTTTPQPVGAGRWLQTYCWNCREPVYIDRDSL